MTVQVDCLILAVLKMWVNLNILYQQRTNSFVKFVSILI